MNEQFKKELLKYFSNFELVKYKKGQIICESGKEIDGLAFIKSGYVRMYSVSNGGLEITTPIFKPLLPSTYLNLVLNKKNKHNFQAISAVEMYVIPKNEAIKYLDENPEVKENLYKSVLNDYIDLAINLQKIISTDAYTKVAILISTMLNKSGENKDKNVEIRFAVPHRMIASMTGLTRETVTLQLLKMQKDGYITTKGRHLVIKDMVKFIELTTL